MFLWGKEAESGKEKLASKGKSDPTGKIPSAVAEAMRDKKDVHGLWSVTRLELPESGGEHTYIHRGSAYTRGGGANLPNMPSHLAGRVDLPGVANHFKRNAGAYSLGALGAGALIGGGAYYMGKRKEKQKTASEKEDKPTYLAQLARSAPVTGARLLVDIPATALEGAIENAIIGKSSKSSKTPIWRKVTGTIGGTGVSALSSPLYYSGMKDAGSSDPETRRKGGLKMLAGSILGGVSGGLTEGAIEGGFKRALTRAPTKVVLGLPQLAASYYAATKAGDKDTSVKKQMLLGAALGGGIGSAKGALETAYENRGLWKSDRKLFKKMVLGRGIGRGVSGVIKGGTSAFIVNKLLGIGNNKKKS